MNWRLGVVAALGLWLAIYAWSVFRPRTIHEEAYHGAADRVRELLAAGGRAAVEQEDAFGNAPLHWAAKGGHLDIVELLLSHGASASKANGSGSSAMHWGTFSGNADAVLKRLAAAGADPNQRNSAGETPLFWASMFAQEGAVGALLGLGADPKLADHNGDTPLHLMPPGCERNRACAEVVKMLFRAGASFDAKNALGVYPLRDFDFAYVPPQEN